EMLDLEGSKDKPYDYIDIYDGTDINGRFLGRFSGEVEPGKLVAKSGAAFIEFRSDCQINKKGWHISWSSTREAAACALPNSLLASNISPMFATLSWNPVADADGYVVTVRRQLGSRVGRYATKESSINLSGLGANGLYQWQIQAICNGDSSAISGESFLTPNIARDPNPKTYTTKANNGRFYDSGSTLAGYGNNEDWVYRITPGNGGRVELSFSAFETEAEHDFLEIFDGNGTSAKLLGRYDGKNLPLNRAFRSSGNALTLRFRSDNRTNAPGWTASWKTIGGAVADNGNVGGNTGGNTGGNNTNTGNNNTNSGNAGTVIPPPVFDGKFAANLNYASTSPQTKPILNQKYSSSFQLKFDDKDRSGRGIVSRFYNLAQATPEGYLSQTNNGFFYDNFDTGLSKRWTSKAGTWQIDQGQLVQTNTSVGNTNLYASLNQRSNETYLYHWQARMTGNSGNLRHGIHFFASAPGNENRGNSYFIWIRDGNAGDYVEIYKTYKNQFDRKVQKSVQLETGKVYDFKTIYNPQKGRIEVYVNNRFTASWVDPYPLTSGKGISLRSGNSIVAYDNIVVYKKRASSNVRVSVGSGGDLGPNGSFIANSLIVDRNIRWSPVGQGNASIGNAVAPNPGSGGNPVDESGSTLSFNKDFSYQLSPPANAKPFYLVADYDGKIWGANDNQGFFLDEFDGNRINGRWTMVKGSWKFNDDVLEQSDQNEGNGSIYTTLKQSANETYLYHWRAKLVSRGDNQRFGLHFFASDGRKENRGDSYFVWFRNYNAVQDKVEIYEVRNDVFTQAATEIISLNPGNWYDCKLTYSPKSGVIQIFLNNQLVLSWKDPSPITSGKHLSFRTGNSLMQFDDLRVYRQASSSAPMISVGGGSDMIRFKSQGDQPAAKIFSTALSPDNRWQAIKEEPVVIK
ncbi:MAG: CUB domain-containing protein, partial [Bacteroidota bacterium]